MLRRNALGRTFMKRLAATAVPLLLVVQSLLAQTASPDDTASAAIDASPSASVSGGAIAAVGGIFCLIWLIPIVLWLWAAIFVTKDAKRRNSPNATMVTVLTWIPFTWFIGWIIHLATRPKTTGTTTT
jgi:hypothetical protein